MSAAADQRMSTCCRSWSTGSRTAAHLMTLSSSNSSRHCPSPSTAHCRFAGGRLGRITKRATPKAPPASSVRHDAAGKAQFCLYDDCRQTEEHLMIARLLLAAVSLLYAVHVPAARAEWPER